MVQKEVYHTVDHFERQGLGPFLEHVCGYLKGDRTVPVSKANSIPGGVSLTFTFSNTLLWKFQEDSDSLRKPYEVAIKYGLRGYSRGGKNGIIYQDKNCSLLEQTERLVEVHASEIVEDLDVPREGLDSLKKVKIVWHEPSGRRIVGVYRPENKRVIFLNFASY